MEFLKLIRENSFKVKHNFTRDLLFYIQTSKSGANFYIQISWIQIEQNMQQYFPLKSKLGFFNFIIEFDLLKCVQEIVK